MYVVEYTQLYKQANAVHFAPLSLHNLDTSKGRATLGQGVRPKDSLDQSDYPKEKKSAGLSVSNFRGSQEEVHPAVGQRKASSEARKVSPVFKRESLAN
jgi:hypothetical protein